MEYTAGPNKLPTSGQQITAKFAFTIVYVESGRIGSGLIRPASPRSALIRPVDLRIRNFSLYSDRVSIGFGTDRIFLPTLLKTYVVRAFPIKGEINESHKVSNNIG
ncbi:Uncharacterized protein Fot_55795 [Forsythia ovata]|uniref:Uncharacterized protein n=1 Tax=Forsythia ovata TaxID=205694 RepID=A0ABD1P4P2_9LAMI